MPPSIRGHPLRGILRMWALISVSMNCLIVIAHTTFHAAIRYYLQCYLVSFTLVCCEIYYALQSFTSFPKTAGYGFFLVFCTYIVHTGLFFCTHLCRTFVTQLDSSIFMRCQGLP
jgi:hypothetical protein